jgi:hypothetical protein
MTKCFTVKNAKYATNKNARVVLASSLGCHFAERIREGLCFGQGAVDDSVARRLVFDLKEIKHAVCYRAVKH